MKTPHAQNNFLAYLLVLAALFVLIFFTKNIFADMQVVLDEKDQNNSILQDKRETLSELKALKSELEQEGSEALAEIEWFRGEFSDKDILNYIHEYAWGVNAGNARILVREVSISGDQVSDLGFNKASVDVSASFSSEATMFEFINYLTSSGEKYKFYISNFSYPMNDSSGNLQVSIPLTLYYK